MQDGIGINIGQIHVHGISFLQGSNVGKGCHAILRINASCLKHQLRSVQLSLTLQALRFRGGLGTNQRRFGIGRAQLLDLIQMNAIDLDLGFFSFQFRQLQIFFLVVTFILDLIFQLLVGDRIGNANATQMKLIELTMERGFFVPPRHNGLAEGAFHLFTILKVFGKGNGCGAVANGILGAGGNHILISQGQFFMKLGEFVLNEKVGKVHVNVKFQSH
mmetsp:Transcript_37477/g.77737  ORF Transcript_37477/g.77737 Transcript_37477/m.77737 type:complete len:218 (-) Transcript_37477:1924-2577(-)